MFIILAFLSHAQSFTEVKVGVEEAPPFSYYQDGRWQGKSVELFEQIAFANRWLPQYYEVEDRFAAIDNGTVDIYLPAVTLTAKREEKYDFSYQYYKDHLSFTDHDEITFSSYIFSFLKKAVSTLSIAIPVLTFVAAIYFVFEKQENARWNMARNLFDSMYWAMTTAATVGYGDEAPKTILGRTTAMLWMVFGIMFFSWIITSMSTEPEVPSMPENLVVLQNTTGHEYCIKHHLNCLAVESEAQLKAAWIAGSDVLHDESLLQTFVPADNLNKIVPQYYGFLFPENSSFLEQTNKELLFILNKD